MPPQLAHDKPPLHSSDIMQYGKPTKSDQRESQRKQGSEDKQKMRRKRTGGPLKKKRKGSWPALHIDTATGPTEP